MGMVGSIGATSVGEYEITITPHGGAEWTDGTTSAEVYVWNIIKYDSCRENNWKFERICKKKCS